MRRTPPRPAVPAALVPVLFVPVLLVLALFVLAGCDPFDTRFDDVEEARSYRARRLTVAPPPGDELDVMTWNIKFGGGRIDFFFDCHGDAVLMGDETVLANLDSVAAEIRRLDPDVLMLQEVDVQSKRSAYIDQVQWLLDHTDLNYGVYASQWKADFVPTDGIGRVESGIAVLSRWPLHDARRIALPERTDQSGVERYFYLKRALLVARLDLPDADDLYVVTTHLEAFSKDDTKKRQLDVLKRELDVLDAAGRRFVMGGDLNMVPPGTVVLKDFPDEACQDDPDFEPTDFAAEAGWIDPLYDAYSPAVHLADYRRNNAPYFTHSTSKVHFWNRKLDYLFTNGAWAAGSELTHQGLTAGGTETMSLSDHAPLTARLVLTR